MQNEILKFNQRLNDIPRSSDANPSVVYSVNYTANDASQVNPFTELMKNEKFKFTGKLKFGKIGYKEFSVDYCSETQAKISTELVISELRKKNIEIRTTEKTYSSKKISSSFVNKHLLDFSLPRRKRTEKDDCEKNSFIMISSSDLMMQLFRLI